MSVYLNNSEEGGRGEKDRWIGIAIDGWIERYINIYIKRRIEWNIGEEDRWIKR